MEEQVAERIMVRACPEKCFEILADFEDYPAWSPDIKEVTVLERNDQGRATLVTIRAAAFGRSTSLTLAYDYSGAPGRLSWVQQEGDLTRRYDGTYSFEPAGDETEVTYQLTVDLKVSLPGFVKRRAESRLVSGALRELKARAER